MPKKRFTKRTRVKSYTRTTPSGKRVRVKSYMRTTH